MKRGIYLVANQRNATLCANLVFSIRAAGCQLPIRLIHFGGQPVQAPELLQQVQLMRAEDFPREAQDLVSELATVLTDCPRGFLYRFLGWFGDWDEFIYSDNDIVALMNWERLFEFMPGHDLVHADEEYTTQGRFNYDQPGRIEEIFGKGSLLSAVTAGHFLARRDDKLVADMRQAIAWFRQNPGIAKRHDQALLHVASLVGRWKMLNLCQPPHGWLSSWAGDYRNPLALVQAIQSNPVRNISHIHYSGGAPVGIEPMADFLSANLSPKQRTDRLTRLGILKIAGWLKIQHQYRRLRNGLHHRWKAYTQR